MIYRSRIFFLFSLILTIFASVAYSTSYHSITIDGANDFASDEDWSGNATGVTWYYTWDASNVYVGATNDNIDENNSNKWVFVFIDTDPQQSLPNFYGDGDSSLHNWGTGSDGSLPFNADYYLRWKNDNSHTNLQEWNGSSWVDSDQSNIAAWQSGTFLELRIPLANIGNPEHIYILGCMHDQSGAGWHYYSLDGNADGSGPSWTNQLGFVLDDGLSPDFPPNYENYPTATVQSGDWNSTTTWLNGIVADQPANVYVRNGHTLTQNENEGVRSFTIRPGGVYNGNAKQLSIHDNGYFINDGTFNPQNNIINFNGENEVYGTAEFYAASVFGRVDFGAGVSTVTNYFQMYNGGWVDTNPPNYLDNSFMSFNMNGAYTVMDEWVTGTATGPGTPYNVSILNNTDLDFGAVTGFRNVKGNLSIAFDSSLTLSTAPGGDLVIQGHFDNDNNFEAYERSVTFNGTSSGQVIQGSANTTFGYLVSENPIILTVWNGRTLIIEREIDVKNGGVFDLGGQTLHLSSWNDNEGADIRVTDGTFLLGGGDVIMTGGTSVNPHTVYDFVNFYDLSLNGGGAEFFNGAAINGTFEMQAGAYVDDYPLLYYSGSTLLYNTGGIFLPDDEWFSGPPSYNPGYPQNVMIAGGTELNFGSLTTSRYIQENLTLDAGSTMTLSSAIGADLYVAGDFTANGDFNGNERAVFMNGANQQNITGDVLFDHLMIDNPLGVAVSSGTTIDDRLVVYDGGVAGSVSPSYNSSAVLHYETSSHEAANEWREGATSGAGVPGYVTVSSGSSITFPAGSASSWFAPQELNILGEITAPEGTLFIGGDLTVSSGGNILPNGGTINFNGTGIQEFAADSPVTLNDLTIGAGAVLDETVSADNISVSGILSNNGIIRKSQNISETGNVGFGLTAASIEVTNQGALSNITIDRTDSAAPIADTTILTDKYWSITPTGGSFTLNLTLPHNLRNDRAAHLARWNGSAWEYGRSSSTAQTVTLNNVTQLSNWAVALPGPMVDLNGGSAGIDHTASFTEGDPAVNLADAAATITDATAANLTSMTITLNIIPDGTLESLDADVTGTSIAKSYSNSTGELLLTGTDTLANYETVLRSMSYNNTSDTPDETDRIIAFTAMDENSREGEEARTTLTVTATAASVNDWKKIDY